ncbi:hypothetical protein RhiirA1_390635 [Rhizophagus irregularis]|uniref:Uncharacterized protein n=1 Tax=Rhizophagus irregularis TaxID=588596 RepID=A0A2N0S6Y7_9GLOM|nr:hypothetical protein RhiirA1_390635 [Rhizophagus irregularis]
MEENGKRSYEYILKILIRNEFSSDKEELKFSVRESDVGLGVNSYVPKLLENFKNNSNRRKLDEDLYLELSFLEKYMEKMNIKFIEGDFLLLSSLDKIRLKLREELINEKSVKDLKILYEKLKILVGKEKYWELVYRRKRHEKLEFNYEISLAFTLE